MSVFVTFESCIRAASAFESSDPITTLKNEWTPLLYTGILLSKKSWFGRIVAWLWDCAYLFRIADENDELRRIVRVAQRAVQSIVTGQNPARELLACTYIPEAAQRIQKIACSLLKCSPSEWAVASVGARMKVAIEIFENLTPLPPPVQSICSLRECVRGEEEYYLLWLQEFKKGLFRCPSSRIVCDALNGLIYVAFQESLRSSQAISNVYEQSGRAFFEQGETLKHDVHITDKQVEQESSRIMLKLYRRGIPFDSFVDTDDEGLPDGHFAFSLADGRFACFCTSSSAHMVVHAINGFLIPIWRASVAECQTLVPVVQCYDIERMKKCALIEYLEGPLLQVVNERGTFPGLVRFFQTWIKSGLSCSIPIEDLWVTSKGDIVSFSPCVPKHEPFSIVALEAFLHKFPERKELFHALDFFAQKEIRILESLLLQKGCFCNRPELEALLRLEGFSSDMFTSVKELLQKIHVAASRPIPHEASWDTTIMERYFLLAREESCFFFPTEQLLRRLG